MRRTALMFVLLLCAVPVRARAQAPATQPTAASPVPVKLGESSAKLNGPWKFHPGDDMAWARPGFDDSSWGSMDLTTPPGTEATGWTMHGYPGYSGFAWYRLQVNVQGANHRLALKMPDQADDAYQVYVNGQLVGDFGKFNGKGVTAYPSLPVGMYSGGFGYR